MTVTPSTLSIALAPGATASANAQVGKKLGAVVLVDNSAFVTWSTSDASIATVTPSGLSATITGVGHGSAIITAVSNGASGSTTVTVTAPTCSPLTANNPSATPGAISGSLGPADCRDDRANAAGRPADFYRLVVASDQLLTIDVSASGFTPDIRLISPTTTVVDVATGAAGRIQRAVAAGTYTIAVGTTSGSGGTYSVTLASSPITSCLLTNSTTTTVPATITGTLAVTDCRLSTSGLPAARLYRFTLSSAQTVTAVLTSTAFPPRLTISDATGRSIADGRDSLAANQQRASSPLAAGVYYAIVSGTTANPLGAFTLALSTGAPQAGPLTYVFVLDSVTLEVGTAQTFYAVGYDASFTYIPITPTWSVTAGGGTISSTGAFTAGTTPGTFANTIKASVGSISSNGATVIVIPTLPACTSARSISTVTPTTAATTLGGSLATTDCKLSSGRFYAKIYRLSVTATATVQIDQSSATLDSYIYLFDANLNTIEENDDDPSRVSTLDSRIIRSLAAGTYYIGVTSFGLGARGAFTLTVKTVP